jgi:hypothetical protein
MIVLDRIVTRSLVAMNAFTASLAHRVKSNATLLTAMNGTEVHEKVGVNVTRMLLTMIVRPGMENAAWNILLFA